MYDKGEDKKVEKIVSSRLYRKLVDDGIVNLVKR